MKLDNVRFGRSFSDAPAPLAVDDIHYTVLLRREVVQEYELTVTVPSSSKSALTDARQIACVLANGRPELWKDVKVSAPFAAKVTQK